MTRVSLVEAYDNKDVIKQISDLKDAVGNLDTESVTGIVNDVNTLKTQMFNVNNTVQTQGQSISQLRGNNVTQVTLSENLGSITSALSKQDGTVLTSQPVNLKQVKTAVLVPGSSPNIFRLSLTLSDDSVIESNDIALQLETIEGQDIYMTAVELIEDSASHKLQVKVTRSDGSTVLSNNVTYDYPSVADAVTEGLVKSSSAEGNVTVNADATMTVNGYTTVSENAEEALRQSATANDRLNYMCNDITTLQGNVSQNTADIGALSSQIDDLDLEGYVQYSENGNIVLGESQMTPTAVKVSDSYGSTEQTSEGLTVTEGTKKVFIDTDAITVTENGTDTVISYDSLLPDASVQEQLTALRNDVDDNAGDISALEAETIQLRTQLNGKQDALTAGAGVTISGNVISADVGIKLTVVTQLPSTGESGTIYLVSRGTPEDENAYDEWIWTDNRWEMIGNTSVDLSQYLSKDSSGYYSLTSNEEIHILNSDNSTAMILASRNGRGTIYLNDMNDSTIHSSQSAGSVKVESNDGTFIGESNLMSGVLSLTSGVVGSTPYSYADYGVSNIASRLGSNYREFSFDTSDENGIVRKKDLTDFATTESVTAVQNSVNAVSESVNTKVSTFQGTEYEGKILKVDATGNLVLADPSKSAAPSGLVSFYDWNGRLLHEYTTEEFLALGEMPALPEDNELIHYQEWNWDWEHAVTEVNANQGWLEVGCNVCAHDGKYHAFVLYNPINVYAYAAGLADNNGAVVTIDWGDGTIEDIDTSTLPRVHHQYEDCASIYHITIAGNGYIENDCMLEILPPNYNGGFKMTTHQHIVGVPSNAVITLNNVFGHRSKLDSEGIGSTDSRYSTVPMTSSQSAEGIVNLYGSDRTEPLVVPSKCRLTGQQQLNSVGTLICNNYEQLIIEEGFASMVNGLSYKNTENYSRKGGVITKSDTLSGWSNNGSFFKITLADTTSYVSQNGPILMCDAREYKQITGYPIFTVEPYNNTATSAWSSPFMGGYHKVLDGTTRLCLATPSSSYSKFNSAVVDCRDCTGIPTLATLDTINSRRVTVIVPDNLYEEWIAEESWNVLETHTRLTIKKLSDYKGVLDIPGLTDVLVDVSI